MYWFYQIESVQLPVETHMGPVSINSPIITNTTFTQFVIVSIVFFSRDDSYCI